MIKVLPLENSKIEPYYRIVARIGIDNGRYYETRMNTLTDKGSESGYEYMTFERAEELVVWWRGLAEKCRGKWDRAFGLDTEGLWELNGYLKEKDYDDYFKGHCLYCQLRECGLKEEEIKNVVEMYWLYMSLLETCVDDVLNEITDIGIEYVDEMGRVHQCEVV